VWRLCDGYIPVLVVSIGFRIMAMSDSEPNSPIPRSESRLSISNRLVSVGLAAVLVGIQMTWAAFLGWTLLHFL
jgi:hypothetical protein